MASKGKRGYVQRGVTLIELMVVVAVVGVLVGLAAFILKPSGYARTARGYGDMIIAEIETMRLRSTASNRWQRIEAFSDGIIVYQSTTEGMREPTFADWEETSQLFPPGGVSIFAHVTETRDTGGDAVPSEGEGLSPGIDFNFPDNTIDFLPDGSMRRPATLYLRNREGDSQIRVATYRATGTAYLLDSW